MCFYWFEDAGDRWKVTSEIKGTRGFALVGVIGLYAPQVLGVGYEAIQYIPSISRRLGRERRSCPP